MQTGGRKEYQVMRKKGSTVFNGKTIFKHKVHEGHEGKRP
jgi:hypothetical protein